MYVTLNSNLKSSMATCEKTVPENFNNKRSRARRWSCSSLRCWLIFWAYLRLALSVLRFVLLSIMTYQMFGYFFYQWDPTYIRELHFELMYVAFGLALQLLEFGMVVTFIVAGVKKSARLYRVYLRYCILILILYITAVLMCLTLADEVNFGEIYLSYQFIHLLAAGNDAVAFGVAAILTIGLESLLIYLIKRLINKYSCIEAHVTCEKV